MIDIQTRGLTDLMCCWRQRLQKAGRWILLLCLLASVPACSLKLMYNNLDRFIRWQVSDYVDLNAEQKRFLNKQVTEVLYWHRKNHLPLYSDYFITLSQQVTDEVTPESIRSMMAQFFVWGEEIESHALPVATAMLASLTDAQVAALPERLQASNLEFAEDEMEGSLAEQQARWAEEFADAMQRFTGRLDEQQKAYIARRAGSYQPERVMWAEYRQRWQQDMLLLLDERKQSTFAEDFKQLVHARESYYGETFAAINKANEQLGLETASYVLSNLSEKQNQRFSQTLREWGEDFAELASQG